MSDTIDSIDAGTLPVPSRTGDNTTQTYAVWYDDGLLQPVDSRVEAVRDARFARSANWPRAMAVRVTIERLDP